MGVDGIDERIAVVDERYAGLPEIVQFEREYGEKHVNPCLEFPVAPWTGCPGFGGDVVEHLDCSVVAESGYPHVESRIVDKNHDIRLPSDYVLLAESQVGEQLESLGEYFRSTHYGAVAVMPDQAVFSAACCGRCIHHVASPVPERCFGVAFYEPLDQVASMQVSGGLSGNQIIAHSLSYSPESVLSMLCGVMVM